MSMNFEQLLLPAAKLDLRSQAEYYLESAGEEIADRFYAAFEQALDHILAWPATGTPFQGSSPRFAGLRSWPLTGFLDIRVYYRLTADSVEIVRLIHGKRDLVRQLPEDNSTP